MSTTRTAGGQRHQDLQHLLKVRRSAFASHYRRKVDQLADRVSFPRLAAFLPQHLWPWVRDYLKYALHPKHPFLTYAAGGERGCYAMSSAGSSQAVKISIAGDWGTGTAEAERVGRCIERFRPDYSIHLGDVYYVGDPQEVQENFLGAPRAGYQGVRWPMGTLGSFSLNANHEMYANGNGYFEILLPALGIPGSRDRTQLASFFCLQNDTWRILALDTGYNSTGMPILSQIPLLGSLPGIAPSYKLEPAVLEWMRSTVDPRRNPRATILLTHHQYFSAFEDDCVAPAKQLMPFFADQDVIWLWGHEHRLAIYDRHAKGGITAFGRCVGHGGMPVEIGPPRPKARAPLLYYDHRTYRRIERTSVGMNGFVNVTLEGDNATLEYRDLDDRVVVRERFRADGTKLSQSFELVAPGLERHEES